jgi:calcineurin-like phosphoesterase family protein
MTYYCILQSIHTFKKVREWIAPNLPLKTTLIITTADLEYERRRFWHFFHKNILKFCNASRPYSSVEEMNEGLVEHWNSVVGEDDVVLHLGDFSFKGKEATEEILSQLNGNIVFVFGNHDKVLRSSIKGLTTYDYLEFRFNGVKVCCSHYPFVSWNQQGRGSVMLFGHVHGSYEGKGRSIDVGFDAHCEIIPLQEAIDFCLEKEIYCPDHHKIIEEK